MREVAIRYTKPQADKLNNIRTLKYILFRYWLQALQFWYYFIYYFNLNFFKYDEKILNLRYVININILIFTIYPEFSNLIITVGKNQV